MNSKNIGPIRIRKQFFSLGSFNLSFSEWKSNVTGDKFENKFHAIVCSKLHAKKVSLRSG